MNKTVEEAMAINEYDDIPDVEIGDVVNINDIWDGNGEMPTESYSYLLSSNGKDHNSNIDVYINYVFETLTNGQIKITKIELI